MKKCLLLFFLLANLFLPANIFGQRGLSLHFGPAFPLSDFKSDDINNDNAGGASLGFNLGSKYMFNTDDQVVGMFVGIDFNFNGLKSSIKDDIKQSMGSGVDIKYYKYVNVPLMAGINIRLNADQNIAFIIDAGIGFDFLKVTKMKFESGGRELTVKFKSDPQLAFQLGGGLLFGGKTSLEFIYNALGTHNISAEGAMAGDTGVISAIQSKR